jgi:chromate reductase
VKILGISGSLRVQSHNRKLLTVAARRLPEYVELHVFDQLPEIPPYNQDLEAGPPPVAVAQLKQAIAGANAVLVATPEYNSSLPGVLKNALDWVSRPFDENPLRGKPAAVIGASTGGFGAVQAQADARRVLARIGARVVPLDLPVPMAGGLFDDPPYALPKALHGRLDGLLAELVAEAERSAQSLAA